MSFFDAIGDFFSGLIGTPDIPAVKVTAAESKVSAYDPRAPRTLCLGLSGWTTSVGWQMTHSHQGKQAVKEILTQVLIAGDHPMGQLRHIVIADKKYTVGTTLGSSGSDFLPITLEQTQVLGGVAGNWQHYDLFATGPWYVPNRLKKLSENPNVVQNMRPFWRLDGGVHRAVLTFRWFDGTQVSELRDDPWMRHIDKWINANRTFRNMACLVVAWRMGINQDVFSGQPSRLLPVTDGASDVHRFNLGTAAFSFNAVYGLAHWLMWEYGAFQEVDGNWNDVGLTVNDFDSTILAAEGLVAAESVADGTRYNVAYQIASGTDAQEVYDTFDFLLGGARVWLRGNGKWAIRCGHPRTSVAHFNLDEVGENIVCRRHRPHSEKYNTVTVGYLEESLFEMREADKFDPNYRSADDGKQLFESITNRGRHGGAANKRLALIKLDRHRLEEAVTFDCWFRFGSVGVLGGGDQACALRVEPGDIVTIDYSTRGWTQKQFEVTGKVYHPDREAFTIECAEWGSIRWNGVGDTPDEVGDDAGKWDGFLEAPTGLTVVLVNQPATTKTDGTLLAQVLFDCDDHPEETLVSFLGGYHWRWRRANTTVWSAATTRESRHQVALEIPKFYYVEVQAYTTMGRGQTTSEWVRKTLRIQPPNALPPTAQELAELAGEPYEVVTLPGVLPLPNPVSDTSQGGNLIADWDFRRSAGLSSSLYWDDRAAVPVQPGDVTFLNAGGKTAPPCVNIYSGSDQVAIGANGVYVGSSTVWVSGTADVQANQDLQERRPHPSQPGEIFRFGAWVRTSLATITGSYDLVFRGRDLNGQLLFGAQTNIGEVYSLSAWKRRETIVQVPHGAQPPRFGGVEAVATRSGSGATILLPLVQPQAINRRIFAYAAINGAATVESDAGGTPSMLFRGRRTTTSGDDVAFFCYAGDATNGETLSGGQVTQNAGSNWVVVAGALGGEVDNPVNMPALQEIGLASVQTNPSNPLSPTYPTTGANPPGLSPIAQDDTLHAVIAIHADTGHAVTPPDSTWQLEGSLISGDVGLFVYGRRATGSESGTQLFAWSGTGGVPVAQAAIFRWRHCRGEVRLIEALMRANRGVTGGPSAYRFDGLVLERLLEIPAVVNGSFIGFYPSFANTVSGNRRVIAQSPFFYPPPDGFAWEIEASFHYRMNRLLSNSDGGNFEVWLNRIRESDGSLTPIFGTDASTGVTITRYIGGTGGSPGEDRYGEFKLKVQDPLTPAAGTTTRDRFKYSFGGRMKSFNAGTFEWGAQQRNLTLRQTLTAFAGESGGGVE